MGARPAGASRQQPPRALRQAGNPVAPTQSESRRRWRIWSTISSQSWTQPRVSVPPSSGSRKGGSVAALFAATFPQRTSRLVLYGAWPRILRAPDFDRSSPPNSRSSLAWPIAGVRASRCPRSRPAVPPTLSPANRGLGFSVPPRAGMVRDLFRLYPEIDIRDILPAIRAETLVLHRTGDQAVPVACGRYLAEHIPGARYVGLEGDDHMWVAGNTDALIDEVEEFVTGFRHSPEPDRILATILFTDIVGSTEQAPPATSGGPRCWRPTTRRCDVSSSGFEEGDRHRR